MLLRLILIFSNFGDHLFSNLDPACPLPRTELNPSQQLTVFPVLITRLIWAIPLHCLILIYYFTPRGSLGSNLNIIKGWLHITSSSAINMIFNSKTPVLVVYPFLTKKDLAYFLH